MNKNLKTTSQDSKIVLAKSKSLLNMANSLLNRENSNLDKSFQFKPYFAAGHLSGINSISISPNGKTALSASYDCTVKLWNIEKGEVIRTYDEHTDWVNSVDISSDGKVAISADRRGIIKLWDIESGKTIQTFIGHTYINCVALSPNGKYAVSGSGFFKKDIKSNLKLWDVSNGECIQTFNGHIGLVKSVVFSVDGNTIISATDNNKIEQWDIESGELIRRFDQNYSFNNPIAISPNGKMIAYENGYNDSTLKICNLDTAEELVSIKAHSSSIKSISFSPDNRTVISSSGNFDNTTKLWNIENGEEITTFRTYNNNAMVSFNFDGKSVLFGDTKDGSLKLLDISNGKEIENFDSTNNHVNSEDFEDNCKSIVSTCVNGPLEFCYSVYNKYKNQITYLSQDEETVFYIYLRTTNNKNITIWNTKSEIIQELKIRENEESCWARSFALSLDGKFGISGGVDSILRLWDIESGQELKEFRGHTGAIEDVAISIDGNYVISGSEDSTIKLWNINTGMCLFTTYVSLLKNYAPEITDSAEEELLTRFLSITPDGYFISVDKESIQEFLRINDGPMSCRKLTEAEIKHFRRNNLLDFEE